jgi:hypothetical protein
MSTILVVSDSESQHSLVRAALDEARIFTTILAARDGFEGLRLLMGETVEFLVVVFVWN